MYRLDVSNSKETPIYVQVDPWACLYKVEQNQVITFLIPCDSVQPAFLIDAFDNDNKIVTLVNCEEFFVQVEGEKLHWEDYQSNIDT